MYPFPKVTKHNMSPESAPNVAFFNIYITISEHEADTIRVWGRVTPLPSPPSLYGDIEQHQAELMGGGGADVGTTKRAIWAHEDSNVIWVEAWRGYLRGRGSGCRQNGQTERRWP